MNRAVAAGLLLSIVLCEHAPAARRIPLVVDLCYPPSVIERWTYYPANVIEDGVRAPYALLSVSFASAPRSNGGSRSTSALLTPSGLVWDKSWRHVLYVGTPAQPLAHPVVCATDHWYGLSVHEKRCRVQGRFEPTLLAPEDCEGESRPTRFVGEMVVTE